MFKEIALENTEPRERIKEAALILFSDHGFKSTTIREICKKADVSLALVNYHYKNKKNLYDEIVMEIIQHAFEFNPVSKFISEEMTPEEKLKNTIRLFLHRLLGQDGVGRNPYAVKLIGRELTNPSELMEKVFKEYITKMMELLRSVIIASTDVNISYEEQMRLISSIAGQCLHPLLAKDILAKAGFTITTNEEIERHADHIYAFSLNGLKGYKRG